MATKQLKVCDVTGSTKGVETFDVQISQDGQEVGVDSWTADLSPRALKRLKRFIEKGVSPSKPRKNK